MDDGVRKNYTLKLLVEFDIGMYMFEDSGTPEIEVQYRLEEGFNTFMKDYAQDAEPTTVEVVSIAEQS